MTTLKIAAAIAVLTFTSVGVSELPAQEFKIEMFRLYSHDANGNEVDLKGKVTVEFSARRHRACDGIHGCTCGVTQARYFGLPTTYNGINLKQAVGWKHAFPHTSAQPGAVVYQHGGGPTGHVSRIVSMTGSCTAVVADERGQYERDICGRGAVYVMPGAGTFAQGEQTYSARRSKRGQHQQQVAAVPNSYWDRFNAH